MARLKPMLMAYDVRGEITYAVNPPDESLIYGGELVASAAQSITFPLTPDSTVPWQVFMRFKNPSLSSAVWVTYTPPDVTPATPDLPSTTVGAMNSVLEPAGWVVPGGGSLSFISTNSEDIISVVAYLGVPGNY